MDIKQVKSHEIGNRISPGGEIADSGNTLFICPISPILDLLQASHEP
jgi:hypothetical protein